MKKNSENKFKIFFIFKNLFYDVDSVNSDVLYKEITC